MAMAVGGGRRPGLVCLEACASLGCPLHMLLTCMGSEFLPGLWRMFHGSPIGFERPNPAAFATGSDPSPLSRPADAVGYRSTYFQSAPTR